MSDDLEVRQQQLPPGASAGYRDHFLDFFRRLQALSNRIHATASLDRIMLDLSDELCALFECERLTIYAVRPSKASIGTRVKTGLDSFKHFKLPIDHHSIAGHVALTRKAVNLRDAYDEAELHAHSPHLRFQSEVDARSGYRTRAVLASPILDAASGELLGVVQLLNSVGSDSFPLLAEEGLQQLCATLAVAFAQRMQAPPLRTRYDHLVNTGLLAAPELQLAARAARRKGIDLEQVLLRDFQVRQADLGAALADFFGVPYEPFRAGRQPPPALRDFSREYAQDQQWLLLEQDAGSLVVLTTDPDRVEGSRVVHTLFPRTDIALRVTSHGEFRQTLEQLFGPAEAVADPQAALLARIESALTAEFARDQPALHFTVSRDPEVDGRCLLDYRAEPA